MNKKYKNIKKGLVVFRLIEPKKKNKKNFTIYTIAQCIIFLTTTHRSDQTVLSSRPGFSLDSSRKVLVSAGDGPAWECHAGRESVENGVAQPGPQQEPAWLSAGYTCSHSGSISYRLLKGV